MKPLAILGAGGQLGTEWIHYANQNNLAAKELTSADVDITDYDQAHQVLSEIDPSAIINCAAYTNVDGAENDPDQAMMVNATAVGYLADIANKLNVPLVHYSTDYVFSGSLEDKERFPEGYPEDHNLNPVNAYGRSKAEGEQLLAERCEQFLLIRVAWLCGAYGSNFVTTMLQLARERDELSVVNDQWGSPSFAGNVVLNTHQLLEEEERGIYHITSEGLINWYDFARNIFERSGIDISLKAVGSDEFETKAKRPQFSKLSSRKLAGIEGTVIEDWERGLDRLLNKL